MEPADISALAQASLEEIADQHPDLVADLRKLHPIKAAATFGGLLAKPGLQANAYRLEVLVHLAIAYCEGADTPTSGLVRRSFNDLGNGFCGIVEDPAEDVFVALVNTPQGNFRIFEGIREGATFHLQRILNVAETMPSEAPYDQIRASLEGLLRLSDLVAERAGVRENTLGQELPLDELAGRLVERLSHVRDLVRFTAEDLARLQIPKEVLAAFAFNLDEGAGLLPESLGRTQLERRPVALVGDSVYLLLPTAVGSAITRFVIETLISFGQGRVFERVLAADSAELFHETPILGGHAGAPVRFQRIDAGHIGDLVTEVDPGRFLHLMFFVDGLDGFLESGLNGQNADPVGLGSAVKAHAEHVLADVSTRPGFRDGLTLLVGCGWGRGLQLLLEGNLPNGWRFESIAAHDLVTLCWLSGFERLSLWRVLDARREIESRGISFLNANGLLNFVAWALENDGHLVPGGQLPDGFATPGGHSLIVVNQNALRDLRHKVMIEWNPRRVLDLRGRWVAVRKLGKSYFEEENAAPFYASEEDVRNHRLLGVYVAPHRPWWIEIVAPEGAPTHYVFEHWMMLCIWLRRAAPFLDEAYAKLPRGPISIRVSFAEIVGITAGGVTPKNAEQLRSMVRTLASSEKGAIEIEIDKGFDDGLIQPENIAERILVEALVAGAAEVGGEGEDSNKRSILVAAICPNSEARYMHRYEAHSFRELIGSEISAKPMLLESFDHAACLVGLGWRFRSRESGPEIIGVPECTYFLNTVVASLIDEISTALRELDRRSIILALLQNHEYASHDRDVWRRTARANLAMHNDQAASLRTIVDHDNRLGVSFLTTRILLEAAICESPLQGGRQPGRLDLSRLMSRAILAFSFAGWSDAVHWGAMHPRIKITALGDIHMDHSFVGDIYEAFVRAGGEVQVKYAAQQYDELYAPQRTVASAVGLVEDAFLEAWKAEFGASLDAFRAFVDQVEEVGLRQNKPIVTMPRSMVVAMLAGVANTSAEEALEIFSRLTLVSRPEWRVPPEGFENPDWQPWRFRRRLSVLRRPFLQIGDGEDPEIVFAPGLVRESLGVMMGWFHSGEIHQSQDVSAKMASWLGHANNNQRTAFNTLVETRLKDLGWETDKEIHLTKLLQMPSDPKYGDLKRYGDIDVLAWRPESGRVLVIECKDVQFRKTYGEVSEQLADFRGVIRTKGKRDLLKKHLDRVEVVTANAGIVAKRLKLAAPIRLEGHLVFKNPVPMRFAWDHMASRIQLSLYSELDKL